MQLPPRHATCGHARFAAVVLVAALAAPAASAGPCASIPADLLLAPGDEARLDGLVLQLVARRRAGDGGPLALDLLVRTLDAGTGRPRPGSYVPHLDAGFVLTPRSGVALSGRLDFRFPELGPALGVDLSPAVFDGERQAHLAVTIRDQSPLVSHPVCPDFPLHLAFALDLDAIEVEEPPAVEAAPAAANVRFNLVGSLDPDFGAGNQYSDIWGFSNASVHLAILGNVDGTHFIDVTDASNPVERAFIPGSNSPWRDMKTYQDFAYIVTEAANGLQIVDLTNPLAPVLVNQTTEFFFTAHNIYIDEEAGQAWVLGANNGTRILDLTQDPAHPTLIAGWNLRYVHDAYASDGLVYFSEIYDGLEEIYDASNPASLQLLSSFPTPHTFAHNSWANDAQTVLATSDEVPSGTSGIYDVTTKTDPNPMLGEYWSGKNAYIHNVMFDDQDDEKLAISHYTLGIKYVDLHVPGLPFELASFDTYPNNDASSFEGCWGVYTHDPRGYIYASDRATGLYVIEYAPTGGVLAGTVRDAATSATLAGIAVQILPAGIVEATGADGRFALYLDSGPLTVRISQPGYKTALRQANLPLGGSLDLDFDLAPLPKVALAGVARRSDTLAPIPSVEISVEGTTEATATAANGEYLFPEVPIGQRTVLATRLGFASEAGRIVLAPNQSATLDFLLEPGAFTDDVEGDLGWDLGLGDPPGTQGRWERVDPNATAGAAGLVQPELDHTPDPGMLAFITGQSAPGATVNANDVEFGTTTLRSPTLDATTLAVPRLRYHRWFSNNAGAVASGTLHVEISGDGAAWVPLETVTATENSWEREEFDVSSFVAPTETLRVRFVGEPGSFSAPFQVLECGVDDVDLVNGCLARFSPELPDVDGDGRVAACDACPFDSADDADGDGFCGDVDNTPFVASPGQEDGDADGVGDVADNCGAVANPGQEDQDGDGLGNACDPDLDGDGIADVADPDRDGDGVANAADRCPSLSDPLQLDSDGDGDGDLCDLDDGIVQGVRLGVDLILWIPESGADTYDLYRGDLGAAVLAPLATCRRTGIVTPYLVEADLPLPEDGFFYIVTRTAGGLEGSPGPASDGVERVLAVRCP